MIIRVHCKAHNVRNIPPVEFYSFDQVANPDVDEYCRSNPREGYIFGYEQVDCPVVGPVNSHEFAIDILHHITGEHIATIYDKE